MIIKKLISIGGACALFISAFASLDCSPSPNADEEAQIVSSASNKSDTPTPKPKDCSDKAADMVSKLEQALVKVEGGESGDYDEELFTVKLLSIQDEASSNPNTKISLETYGIVTDHKNADNEEWTQHYEVVIRKSEAKFWGINCYIESYKFLGYNL